MKKVLFQMINQIKKVLNSQLSPGSILVIIGLLVYLPLWGWTMHISGLQEGGIYPRLPILGSDSVEYATLANNLIQNGCFSLSDCGAIETFRTPGYPVFVALFLYAFQTLFAVTFVQCFLVLLSAYFLQKIIVSYVGLRLSIYAMILFAIEPTVVLHSIIILSDIPYTFIIILTFFLLVQKKPSLGICAWIGLLNGSAILFRPISLFLLPVFACVYWYMYGQSFKELFKVVGVMFVFSTIFLFPWLMRNQIHTGVFGISSVSSFNLLYYNVPFFLTSKGDGITENILRNLAAEIHLDTEEWHKLENSHKVQTLALQYIKADFLGYAKFHLVKTMPFFFSSSIKNTVYSYNLLYRNDSDYIHADGSVSNLLLNGDFKLLVRRLFGELIFLCERFVWLIAYIIMLCGLFSKHRKIVIISFAFVFYFAILTGPVSYARYRLPTEPFMFIALPLGLLVVSDWFKRLYLFVLQKKNLQK